MSSSALTLSDSDIMYWNPWQPPDSTVMRRARFGLASFAWISWRRFKCSNQFSFSVFLSEPELLPLLPAESPR